MGSTEVADRESDRERGSGRSAYCLASIVALNEVFGFATALYLPSESPWYPLRLPCIKLVRALI